MSKKRINKRPPVIVHQLSRKSISSKRSKSLRTIAIGFIVFVAFIFSFSYYVVNDHNSIRDAVKSNPKATSARITEISKGKGTHTATFEFNVNGQTYTGRTFKEYKGQIGDLIHIEYSKSNPSTNIFSEDTTEETFIDDVVIYTLEIAGIFIVFLFFGLIIIKLGNPKKNLWE